MSRPVHFEIQVDDLERAKTFYGDVFGWTFDDYSAFTGSPYWGVTTGDAGEPGINGGIVPRAAPVSGGQQSPSGAVLTMAVDDFDTTAQRIEQAGGRVVVPKAALPGMAWQGYFTDVDGNTFGIHETDENAS